jgi:hypothetical protein
MTMTIDQERQRIWAVKYRRQLFPGLKLECLAFGKQWIPVYWPVRARRPSWLEGKVPKGTLIRVTYSNRSGESARYCMRRLDELGYRTKICRCRQKPQEVHQ